MKIKKIFSWQVVLGIILIMLSAAVYYIHYLIFRDARYIFNYLISNIAFVFLEVFLVTLVVHNLLALREKQALFKKMNMVIGAFFSEVGRELIKFCIAFDKNSENLSKRLMVRSEWTDAHFNNLQKEIADFACEIDYQRGDWEGLRSFLVKKRSFLLGLLENQNLLEHATFTDLLWAVFHLTEELEGRKELKNLSLTDYEHLCGDLKRAYRQLVSQWLFYMKHLKEDYPYLFSLAMRTNPFDSQATIQLR
jgi:hypothetical protein